MARKPARKSNRASRGLNPRSATPENPSFSLNSDAAWDALTDGAGASSGVSVNRKVALTVSGVWRAVNLLSSSVGRLPLYVYKRNGNGKDRDQKHPAYFPLRRKPNENMTAYNWKQVVMSHVLLRGNHYSLINRELGAFRLTELIPLDPDLVVPVVVNGALWYVCTIDLGGGKSEKRKLRPFEVFHVRGFGNDGITGLDIMTYAREALGLAIAHQRYSSVYFKNNARPSVIFLFPSVVSTEARKQIVRDWERMHAGVENAHRTAVIDKSKDVVIKELTINAKDSQLIEQRKFDLVDVANLWGVPVHKIGGEGRTAYASLEQENQAFLDEGIDPWLVNIEEEAWDKLLSEDEKSNDTHVVEFMRQALVRADLDKRAAYYRIGLGGRPWLTQNEVRGMENMNPSDAPEADEILEPLNMGQGGADNEPAKDSGAKPPAAKPKPPAEDDPEAAAALAALFADTTRRMVKRVQSQAQKTYKEGTLSQWLNAGLILDNDQTVYAAFAPLEALARMPKSSFAIHFLNAMRTDLLENAVATSCDSLVAKIISEKPPCTST